MLTLRSPAKVNLFLRILSKRPDGYHELASLFQAIDLCDILHFSLSTSDTLSCTHPAIPLDSSNLISKAIAAFKIKTGYNTPIQVHLEKNIPLEAGLGGGSSNAATTLWALNKLHNDLLSLSDLQSLASTIGSDVAFFLTQGTAYCTGRGEILNPMPALPHPTHKLWIIKPNKGLSTPLVYRNLDATKLEKRDPQKTLNTFLSQTPQYYNDLEIPAFQLEPSLALLKENLKKDYQTVLMSGSGTSFFCLGNNTPNQADHFVTQTRFINREKSEWY